MKLKKFLLPLLVTPLFLVSCKAEANTPVTTDNEPTPKLAADVPVILNYYDADENHWSVYTETREITKNGELYVEYEIFSDTIWYSKCTLFYVKDDGILIDNPSGIIVLTLIPEEEPATDEEATGTKSELHN